MVPSCAFGSPCRPRWGESSPCARITRNTRVRETRIRSRIRSRAWTLRWPSPWNGERARSVRMAASNCASDSAGVGPRGAGPITPLSALRTSPPRVERRARPLPRPTHPLETIAPPRGRGGRCAHHRDLRVAKGRRRSAARARSRNSSFSIDSSPMCRLAASSAAATGSTGLILQPEFETGQRPRLPLLQPIDLHPDCTRDRVE